MRILKDSELFSPENIAKIEDMKNAVYVCETCLQGRDGEWINQAVAVFWNRDPDNVPHRGSAWFGMFFKLSYPFSKNDKGVLMVTNAISATQKPITGVVAKNGDVIYSRYRHDYRMSPDGTAMVDGGRDYLRTGPWGIGTVILEIQDGELVIVGGNQRMAREEL